MEEDFCVIGSTGNILTEISSEENKTESSTRHKQSKSAVKTKKPELTRAHAVHGASVDQAHTNLAFEIEEDDFIVLDNMGSVINPFRKEDAEDDLLDDTKPNNENPNIKHQNAFETKISKPVEFEMRKVNQWTVHKTDNEKGSSLKDENLEVRVVDPNLTKKLSAVLSPNPYEDDSIHPKRTSNGETGDQSQLVLSPTKLLSDSHLDKSNNDAPARKRPLLKSHMHFRSEDVTDGRTSRPQSKSIALTYSQSLRVPGVRAQSLAEHGQIKLGKSRRLLRDLSFSDADAKSIQNYGHLRNADALPKRDPSSEPKGDIDDEVLDDNKPVQIPEEVLLPMKQLMKELVQRGKVKQVAAMDQDGARMIASYPEWSLSERETVGLVKATMGSQQMLKLLIDNEVYSCFKHGPNKLMARSGDNIIVTQRTESLVLVAHALDDTPGSCLYEVSELSDVLVEKGW